MKPFSLLLAAAALVAGAGFLLRAQEFGSDRPKGKVLLLKNGHAMEGDIERLGTQFCIRHGTSEVWLNADKTVRLCTDWNDAYNYVQTLIKPDDANDRVKLARWCHLHKLTDKALEQARKALELQPGNAEAKLIVTTLERSIQASPKPAIPLSSPVVTAPKADATVDVASETLVNFMTRVQPILMNTCASCHSTNTAGSFRLERVGEGAQKAASQRNLAALLPHVDLERPASSPLLVRATTAHGGAAHPALASRDAKPLQTIQQWIEQTAAKNPHLKSDRVLAKTLVKGEPTTFATQGAVVRAVPPEPKAKTPAKTPPSKTPVVGSTADPTPRPQMQPVRVEPDEYDPAIFNRHFHGSRMQSMDVTSRR